jgi:hypothetical protein
MSRILFALLMIITVMPLSLANEVGDRRVRVALALSNHGCGKCRTDVKSCRAEALQSGRPLVLFIGDCHGKAKELPGSSAIFCRVPEYKIEGESVSGIVVLGLQKGDHKSLAIWKQLPSSATAAEIDDALSVAERGAPAKLDWGY